MFSAILWMLVAVFILGLEGILPSYGALTLMAVIFFSYATTLAFGVGPWFGWCLMGAGVVGGGGAFYLSVVVLLPRLGLIPRAPDPVAPHVPEAALPISVGDEGVTESVMRPRGTVRFSCGRIEAVCELGLVDVGVQVRVVKLVPGGVVVSPTGN